MNTFRVSFSFNFIMLSCLFFITLFANFSFAFVPKSFKVNFKEEHKSMLRKKLKKSSGILYYQYPKKIRIDVLLPSKTSFVSNSKKSWYYTAPFIKSEPGEVTISKRRDYFLIKLFDMLQKGFLKNKLFKIQVQSKKYTLFFYKKTSNKINLKKLIFLFSNTDKRFENLLEMITFDLLNNKKKFSFSNFKLKPKFTKNTFNFLIPPNTRKNH